MAAPLDVQLHNALYRESLLIKEVEELQAKLTEHKQAVDILGNRCLKYEKTFQLIKSLIPL